MLETIAEGVYAFETTLALPMGLRLPARCTVLRLDDGGLALHSPVPIDDATAAEIAALGEVRAIIAPNLFHHLFVKDAASRFPSARVLASASLRKKIPALPGEDLLHPAPRTQPLPGLESTFIEGAPGIDETVFFHARSGSLVCTDMVFNVTEPSTLGTRFFLTCVGCSGRFAQSRVWRVLTKDAARVADAGRRVLAWPFERVIMGHGAVVAEDAHARAEAALARMTAGAEGAG